MLFQEQWRNVLTHSRARRLVNEHGGRVRWSHPLRNIVNFHQERLEFDVRKLSKLISPHKRYWVDFVDGDDLNARAIAIAADRYLFLLTSGLVMALYLGVIRIASRASVFRQLSERTLDEWPQLGLRKGSERLLRRWASEIYEIAASSLKLFTTEQLTVGQAQVAMTIAHFAIEFVLLHELGHVFSGHLDYDLHRESYNRLPRVYTPDPDFVPKAFQQHFELQADSQAATYGFVELVGPTSRWDFKSRPYLAFTGSAFFRSLDEVVDLWLFSIGLVFVMLGEWTGTPSDFVQATHPFPVFRLEHIMERVLTLLTDRPALAPMLSRDNDRFRAARVVETVIASLRECGLGVPRLEASLAVFKSSNEAGRTADRIKEALRRDEPIMRLVRVHLRDASQVPEELRQRGSQFLSLMNQLASMLSDVNGDANQVMASEQFQRMIKSPEFQQLANSYAGQVILRPELQDFLTSAALDPKRVAILRALKSHQTSSPH